MRIFLDTNVVCDAMFDRDPWKAAAQAIVTTTRSGQTIGVISSLTVVNLYYIGRKIVGKQRALDSVRDCLVNFDVAAIDRRVLEDAVQMAGTDFEDRVQLIAAQGSNVDAIVTRDPHGFANSNIPVLSPSALLQQLNIP